MRILYLTGREYSYTRNAVLLNAFSNSAEVINLSSSSKSYFYRHLQVLFRFLKYSSDYDIIFIGFYGYLLIPIVKLFTRKPIIFDAFVSNYQTLCYDRKKFTPTSPLGRIAFYLDKLCCKLADIILLDTDEHIKYFVHKYNISREKFVRIFVGTDEKMFHPLRKHKIGKQKIIFFYCEYQPLHGLEYIVRAAKILKSDNVKFKIVGRGKESPKIQNIVQNEEIENIEFVDWIQYINLPEEINNADLCIGGHFGDTEKASLVIPGKTYQFIAMNKPTLIAFNPANTELFGKSDKSYYAPTADAKGIARQIRKLLQSQQILNKVAKEQYSIYKSTASNKVINFQIANLLANYM